MRRLNSVRGPEGLYWCLNFSLECGLGRLAEKFGDTQTSLGRGGLRPRKACLGVKGLKLHMNQICKVQCPRKSYRVLGHATWDIHSLPPAPGLTGGLAFCIRDGPPAS